MMCLGNQNVSREELVAACREMAASGYAPASGGNASIKTPEGVWITAGGTVLKNLSLDQLVLVDNDGNKLAGEVSPSKEVQLHLAVYRVNPKVNAVFHFHPPYTIAACALLADGDDPLPAFVPTYIMRVHGVKLVPYYHPGSIELARAVEQAAATHQVIILRNHGLVSSGETVTQAVQAIEETEANAHLFLLAGTAGRAIEEEYCRQLKEKYWK